LGWREPVLSVGYRKLRVHLQSLTVRKTHGIPGLSPRWNLIARINGRWLPLIGRPVPGGEPTKVSTDQAILLEQSVELLLPMTEELQIETLGWVSRPAEKLFDIFFDADTGAAPEEVQQDFAAFDIGLDQLTEKVVAGHVGRIGERLTWPAGTVVVEDRVALSEETGHNTDGDFELAFRIEEVQRFDAGSRQDLA